MEIRRSEAKTIQIRTLGWSPYPWLDIEIGMFHERDGTKLAIDFDFRIVSAIVIAVAVLVTVFCWFFSWNLLDAIVITIIIGAGGSISYASERNRTKRKYLSDIHKALDL